MAQNTDTVGSPTTEDRQSSALGRSRTERIQDHLASPPRATVYGLRLTVLVVVLGSWELLSGDPLTEWALLDQFYFATPSAVVAKLYEWAVVDGLSGMLYTHIWLTLQEALMGFAIGASAGVVLGLILGVSQLTSTILTPFVYAAYSVPRLALAPILIVWFGLGVSSKVALVAIVVFFLVFFSTYNGVRDINSELVDVMRVMGAKRRDIHLKVTIPSAMTWVVSGLRISIPYALVAAVVGEFIASRAGLGFLIMAQTQQFSTSGLFAAIFVVVVLSTTLNGLVTLFEKRALRWKSASDRGGTALGW